jgi:hypothetical protein
MIWLTAFGLVGVEVSRTNSTPDPEAVALPVDVVLTA